METAILIGAIAVAGLVCPAMMWWQRRRGRAAACCMPGEKQPGEAEMERLARDHAALSARVAALRRHDDVSFHEARPKL